ncbi:hypothetical protein EDD16DRAFT_245835 [Pisolithus croceorrhizus]|nr:hypothetical protein EDD16DRAFT_245835 [Pisolithus croceorrhizus]KAI6156025.1 hypothetical protein EDD17DRAFT_1067527 [Pisolithus thermaeus]
MLIPSASNLHVYMDRVGAGSGHWALLSRDTVSIGQAFRYLFKSSIMHPCLLVDEILQLIFRCIKDRTTLCALARTCRTFNEPATDLVWETLSDMQLILRNLSCERILCEGRHPRLTQSQPLRLSDNDWGIFRRISSHVRRLDFYAFSINNDVHSWLSFLTSPPDPSFLFPNLHSLSFEAPPLNYSRANNSEDIHAAFPTIARLFCLLFGATLVYAPT